MAKPELKHIVVFEHQKLLVDQGEQYLSESQFQAMVNYYGNHSPFYRLIRKGVQFCEYVGALQIGDTLIEVLPKADNTADKNMWQNLLVNMIRYVWGFPVKESGSSNLKLRHNSVLDLYYELLVGEVELLVRRGLVKKYIREERNAKALKGKLSITKHFQKNMVHKERFYIQTTRYSTDHQLHQVLCCAIKLVGQLNRNGFLASRIGNLLMNFQEQSGLDITQQTFARIRYDRKTIVYKRAMEIAELLLLNYHPDVSRGRRNVLALMFDMNALWERFVLDLLRKSMRSYSVSGQVSKKFWRSAHLGSSMRPDIVLTAQDGNMQIVLDTKWKNLGGNAPSADDLRQMYVYHEYFNAEKVALIYPGQGSNISGQFYLTDQTALSNRFCHVLQIPVDKDFIRWKIALRDAIGTLVKPNEL